MSLLTRFKLRLPKKRWKRVVLYAASTFCIALAIDMSLTAYWRRIAISKETTYITAPLLSGGVPDYVTWINERAANGVTPENNAAVPLVKAIGLVPAYAADEPGWADWENRTVRAMGLPEVHMPSHNVSFAEWMRDRASAGGTGAASAPATQPDDATVQQWATEETAMHSAPWNAADHPEWAQWIDAEQKTLDLAHEAASRGRYYMPAFPREAPYHPGQVIASLLPTLAPTRYVANLLMADAMMHAHDADKRAFARDTTDALKLAALLQNQGEYLVSRMVGRAMMQETDTGILAALASGDLKGQDARDLLAALDALPASPALDLTAERCSMLDLYCASAYYGLSRVPIGGDAPRAAPLIALTVPVRYEAQMAMINEEYDKLDEEVRLPSYQKRLEAVRATERDMVNRYNKALLLFSGYFYAMTSPEDDSVWMPRALQRIEETDTQRELLRLALALSAFRAEKGAYPDSLDALTTPPGNLKAIPADGFNDQPLHYRRVGEGYVLYSVGPNLKDDGGDEKADLVVRMER